MKTVTINTVCGYGLGTSLILKMTLDDVFAEEGIPVEITPCDITSAVGLPVDMIVTSGEMFDQVSSSNPDAICLQVEDFLDKDLMRREIVPTAKKIAEA